MTFKSSGVWSYSRGIVKCNKPWFRPNKILFKKWLTDVKEYVKNNNVKINAYVCGRFLEDIKNTWDIDILITTKETNIENIDNVAVRDLMLYMMKLGHEKYNILIDVFYYVYNEKINGFWYSPDQYKKHGVIETQMLLPFKTIYCNEVLWWKMNPCVKVIDNLYLTTISSPSKKHIERLENGVIYKKPYKII